ncbi:MAG: NAD(P)-dependent oxidoreductase [bacterium]
MKIVCFDVKDYERNMLEKLSEIADELVLIEDSFHSNFANNLEKIKDADIISVFVNSMVGSDDLSQLPNLKFIATRSTGFSHIDLDYCQENGIAVSTVPRYGDVTIAEYAFALLLASAKKIVLSSSDLKNGVIEPDNYIGIDLFGKTVGVIGVGAIGRQFCRIANAIGMNILGYDLYPNEQAIKDYNVKFADLETLLKESDIISIHAPSTKDNVHLIDKKQFEMMKEGVILINTARGEILNTEALYESLLSGKVASCGLDVLECEDIIRNEDDFLQKDECKIIACLKKTLINHRLLKMKNVIVTPHVAYDSKEAIERILSTTNDNIKSFLASNIQNNVIN